MTSQAWDSGTRYGKRLANYFNILDRLIKRLAKQEELTPDDTEQIMRLMGRQTQTVYAIQKLREHLDTIKRIEDIERLLATIPPEAIAAARARQAAPLT